jgi:hypothetical protein
MPEPETKWDENGSSVRSAPSVLPHDAKIRCRIDPAQIRRSSVFIACPGRRLNTSRRASVCMPNTCRFGAQ